MIIHAKKISYMANYVLQKLVQNLLILMFAFKPLA